MHRTKSVKILPEEMNNEARIEKKQMEIICDTTNKLIQICNKKELKVSDLKWQPHYSTVFKQLKCQLELILNSDPTKSLDHLNKIPYLLNLKNNIFTLFNGFAKFVQENGSLIGTKDHIARKSFFMKVVHFQFLYFEIQAYFPNGIYSPNHVKISKMPAKIWWERKFCDNIFVDLDTFIEKFKEDFPFINQAEIFSFRNSINFTSTNITTTFEFDLFTRLYSPWEKLIEVWRIIYSHPAYLHFSTYGDTKDTLSKYLNEPGTYVFRISCKDLGFWTIGYIKSTKEMGQVKVDKSNLIEALVEGNKKNMYLYPNGDCSNPDLSNLNEYRKEIVVNNDDLKLYDCFEDFKECKICRELEKDLQLESCGHQICQTCYKLLRKHDKKLCPFCNQKIVSTTKIVNVKDPSIYVDASTTKISFENHYMHMALQSSQTENKSPPRESRVDSVYSNISDDSEMPPSVPPRIIPDPFTNSRADAKKSVINYPAISHLNSTSSTSVKSSDSQRKDAQKFGESSSSIYSVMSLSSSSNNNEDMYCDIKESETVNHTLPFMRKNQYNSQINPATKEFNFLSNQNEESKNLSAVNLTNKFKEVASVGTDDVYWCPHVDEPNENESDMVDDTYMVPRESVSSTTVQYISVSPVDDTYCNPNDDTDDPVTILVPNGDISEDILSPWSSNDVERALRVAKNDKVLAREILMEFGAKR